MSEKGMHVEVVEADLSRGEHREATLRLLNEYARDPMGDGRALSRAARDTVIAGLRAHPTTLVFLAYWGDEATGLAICFRGFSTFAARGLINISDYYVVPAARELGIGRALLGGIERRARESGCCRITLEVQELNERARRVYSAAGFSQVVHVPEAGGALFLSKELASEEELPTSVSQNVPVGEIEFRTVDYKNDGEVRGYLRLFWELAQTQNEYLTDLTEQFLEHARKAALTNDTETNTFSGIALHQETIVGLHVVRRYEEYGAIGAHVAGLWVRPGYERMGIARTLKEQGEAWARSVGAIFMNTNVHAGNARMLEINEQAGYSLFRYNLRKRL